MNLIPIFAETVTEIQDAVSESNTEKGTPAGEIVEQSSALADVLEAMATAIASGDKKGLVNGARSVSEVCKRLIEAANAFSSSISDRSDQEKVISSVTTVRKCGTDLKVQCAMLAASSGASEKTTGILKVLTSLKESVVQLIERTSFAAMDWNKV